METQTQRLVAPRVDIFENSTGIRLVADVPGAREDDIQLQVEDDALVLEARAASLGDLLWRRSFALPRDVDREKVGATLAGGVLTIDLPRKTEAHPRRIAIHVG